MHSDGVKRIAAAGDQLVRIRLVAGIEDDLIARRVEDIVQSQGQLDDAEVPAKVASDLRDNLDDAMANLFRKLVELTAAERPEILRRIDGLEERHWQRRLTIAVRR